MFANDTNITVTATCFSDLENMVNDELESIGQWLIKPGKNQTLVIMV